MTIQRRQLPPIPAGVDITALVKSNLKLFSDAEIRVIKKKLIDNGRYRFYLDDQGMQQKLKYPVFVYNGKYFAAYPGKKLTLGKSAIAKVKVAQDLESGEWVIDKILTVQQDLDEDFRWSDVENERSCLEAAEMAVVAGREKQVVSFHRPFEFVADSASEESEGVIDAAARELSHSETDSLGSFKGSDASQNKSEDAGDDGKYYLFMQRATGLNLHEWLQRKSALPTIIKMDMSISMINALMRVHEHQVLHRDMKPQNVVFDMFKSLNEAATIIDFGLAVHMVELQEALMAGWGTNGFEAPEIRYVNDDSDGKYSIKSDVYAAGVTLGLVWDLLMLEPREQSDDAIFKSCEGFKGNLELQNHLRSMLHDMLHVDPQRRPELKDILLELHALKDRLSKAERVIHVGILDVASLAMVRDNSDRDYKKLLGDLLGYDQIRLFDSTSTASDVILLQIKQDLQEQGLIVDDAVYFGAYADMEDFIADNNAHRSDDGRIYQYECLPNGVQKKQSATMQYSPANEGRVPPRVVMGDAHADAEPYQWGDWFSWFFGNLPKDVCGVDIPDYQATSLCSSACFGFFSAPRNQQEPQAPANVIGRNPGNHSDRREAGHSNAMPRF